MQNSYNKYTFFWGGPFSQWQRCAFVVDGVQYSSAEQYMMHKKALLFGDFAAAEKILATTDARKQKAIGRTVQRFDAQAWSAVARDVVLRGSFAKFAQNTPLREALLETAGTLLVEASCEDAVWGIGLPEEVAAVTLVAEWPGTNWLGLALTEVREAFTLYGGAPGQA